MKTTFDLPDRLMTEAMKTGCGTTKTATIIYALEQLVRTAKLAKLRTLRGSMPDLDMKLDALRGRRLTGRPSGPCRSSVCAAG